MTLLTDEEINALDCVVINQSDWEEFEVFNPSVISFARAIEQAVLAKVETQEPLAKLSLSTRGMEVTADYGVMCYGEEFDVYRHPAPMQHDMRLKNLQDSHNALAEAHSNVLKENALLEAQNKQLLEALKYALEWIDAVPKGTVLPTMPGFDRDYVDTLISEAGMK